MPGFTLSVEIAASMSDLFDRLTEPALFEEAVTGIEKMDPLSVTLDRVGSQYRLRRTIQGRGVSTTVTVTRYDPPTHYSLTSQIWDVAVSYHYLFYDLSGKGGGGTQRSKLTLVCDIEGDSWHWVLTSLLSAQLKKEDGDSLQEIKRVLEGQ